MKGDTTSSSSMSVTWEISLCLPSFRIRTTSWMRGVAFGKSQAGSLIGEVIPARWSQSPRGWLESYSLSSCTSKWLLSQHRALAWQGTFCPGAEGPVVLQILQASLPPPTCQQKDPILHLQKGMVLGSS